MSCQFDTLIVKSLKGHDFLAMQAGCVEYKLNRHCAGRLRRRKGGFGLDLFAIGIQKRFAGRLVHEYTGYGVFLFRLEIGIRYFIKNRYLTERIDAVAILRGRCRSNLRYADFDGLIFRIDVLMHSQQRVGTIQLIKDNQFCIFI